MIISYLFRVYLVSNYKKAEMTGPPQQKRERGSAKIVTWNRKGDWRCSTEEGWAPCRGERRLIAMGGRRILQEKVEKEQNRAPAQRKREPRQRAEESTGLAHRRVSVQCVGELPRSVQEEGDGG